MALATVCSDILWNLDILAAVNVHQTLLVIGDRLEFDKRPVQWLWRRISGDSREHVLHAIDRTFGMCEELLQSYRYTICNECMQSLATRTVANEMELNEQAEIVSQIYYNLSTVIQRIDPVIRGLRTLSTFERYTEDRSFQNKIARSIDRIKQWKVRGEELRQRIQAHYKVREVLKTEEHEKNENADPKSLTLPEA